MVTRCPKVSGFDIIPELSQAGFDYAELSLRHINLLNQSEKKELLMQLDSYHLPALSCNNFFPDNMPLTGSNIDYSEISRYIDLSFETALYFGIKLIVFGSGSARMVPEGFQREKAIDQLVYLLEKIESYARHGHILIAIEPLRKAECNIINTYAEACELASFVNSPNIGCVADFFHLCEESECLCNIISGKKHLFHVHLANPVERRFPLAIHEQKIRPFLTCLEIAGYSRLISIEAYTERLAAQAKESLNMLRRIELSNKIQDIHSEMSCGQASDTSRFCSSLQKRQ